MVQQRRGPPATPSEVSVEATGGFFSAGEWREFLSEGDGVSAVKDLLALAIFPVWACFGKSQIWCKPVDAARFA
ncbi:hypothetical protein U1Q18_001431 [Sarracenia purpurea var. burkii]